MNELYDIELIKKLKARYFRTLDTNDWAVFGGCLTEGCEANYSDGQLNLTGRDAIVAFMTKHMSGPLVLTMHHGHTPEIELNGENSATGIWYLQDTVMNLKHGMIMTGTAIYHDEYHRQGDEWLISKTGYKRIYECVEPISDSIKVTKNMFAS